MKRIFQLTLFGTLLSIASCSQPDPNKQIDEGKVDKNIYTSKELGWVMEIPKGWTVVERDKSEEYNKKGLEAIGEVIDGEIDVTDLKHLISFQKNQFNIFQSTSQPFKVEYEGEWEATNAELKKIIYAAFLNQGIKVDSSATSTVKVDGLDFRYYSFTVYGPKGDVILNQSIYSRLINGLDFGVNINSNNEEDKSDMLMAWKNSKFKRK
ncbi:hypothetical protein SanaruYs_30380 [Chryseotalea sanaruensis]|uniref:Lipoprotein n=1 Tax=Chryseotalea sanaruensis TaxID=2482724 RepID=A0A401UD47_9BACT|nr:hypothetical protein [Chryseotalea sanaruensis]GCC52799.1 hypothetical protein SanaruYs_30380 [Chryseotalea sanaruensis]